MSSHQVWVGAGLTDKGQVRPSNQDTFAVMNQLGLWIVADGMGGHAGGEVASQLAVESVVNYVQTRTSPATKQEHGQLEDRVLLRQAIEGAHLTILNYATDHSELSGMGTTIVVLRISYNPYPQATIAYVGDSRAYMLRAGILTQLTEDHSTVANYVRLGLITVEQSKTHPHRHMLTKALGIEESAEPDISVHRLNPSDLLMLCTDGLNKMIEDDDIAGIILRGDRSPERVSSALVNEAIQGGGEDNVTVVACAAVI